MEWLAIVLAFQIGTSNNEIAIFEPKENITYWSKTPESAFYIDLEFGIDIFDIFKITGDMKSYQFGLDSGFFAPFRIDYGFKAYFEYKGLSFGFIHQCDHPVIFYFNNKEPLYGSINTELFFRYETKINF